MPNSEVLDNLLSRFGDDVVKAVVAAFALVTVYDDDVAEAEIGRFVEHISDLSEVPPRTAETLFVELTDAMRANRDAAEQAVLEYVTAVKDEPDAAKKVQQAARIAAVADVHLDVRETVILQSIAEALGVDPDSM